MTNVHSRHIRRGTVAAPVVTIDHAEAARLQREQSDAFWGSGVGVVLTLALVVAAPIGFLVLLGAYMWGTAGAWGLPLVLVAIATLLGWMASLNADS